MKIRELEDRERDDLMLLYRHLHNEDAPDALDDIDATWRKIQRNPDFYCVGLFVDTALVGSCCLAVIENLTRGCKPYGVIDNVVIHRDHRRMGYGRELLRHSLSLAWSRRCYKVMLMTGRLDDKTFAFYETAGFSRHEKQAFIARS